MYVLIFAAVLTAQGMTLLDMFIIFNSINDAGKQSPQSPVAVNVIRPAKLAAQKKHNTKETCHNSDDMVSHFGNRAALVQLR